MSHDEFILMNNGQKQYDNITEEIKNSTNKYVWCNKINIIQKKSVLKLTIKD